MTTEEAISFGNMWLELNEDAEESETYQFFKMAISVLSAQNEAMTEEELAEFKQELANAVPEREKVTDADIMECARAIKGYCVKHRNEQNFYMCDTCEYSSSERSAVSYSYGEKDKCPFNVPAYWNLPEPNVEDRGGVKSFYDRMTEELGENWDTPVDTRGE